MDLAPVCLSLPRYIHSSTVNVAKSSPVDMARLGVHQYQLFATSKTSVLFLIPLLSICTNGAAQMGMFGYIISNCIYFLRMQSCHCFPQNFLF